MNKIGIGIIGMGRIGKIHAENLLRLPGANVVSVCDLYAGDELLSWAAERSIPHVTRNSADVLARPDVDAVFICSPTDTHVPLIQQAAQAGKHIFCEKPISMDVRDTIAALEAVARAGVQLQIGFNRRFDRNFRTVKANISGGTIGRLHLLKITSRDPAPPSEAYIRSSGGMFMDMTIHDFDMARFLAASEVEEVYAQGGVLIDPVFGKYGDTDTAVVVLRFENGAFGVIDNSRRAVYGYDQRVEAFGAEGCVTADNEYPNTVRTMSAGGVFRAKPLYFFLERYQDAYFEEVREFVECLAENRPVPVDGRDGLQAERIALAAKMSFQQKRPVHLKEVPAWPT